MKCIICHNKSLKSFYKGGQEKSVTSDCRTLNYSIDTYYCHNCFHVQKDTNQHYLNNVDSLYQNYEAFCLNQGGEPLSFNDEIPYSRSSQIINNCINYIEGANNALDIGCGSGVFLKALNQFNTDITLCGYDVSTHTKNMIEKINGVKAFYSGELTHIKAKFDLVILSHVLEHIISPIDSLMMIKGLLSKKGKLIIQVPNLKENPIDIMVYDHASHFTKKSLSNLLYKVFDYVYLPKKQINKEITFIVSNLPIKGEVEYKLYNDENLSIALEETLQSIKHIETLSLIDKPAYVFSTGPAGTLLGHLLGDNLIGFIDEDECRVGKQHLNKQVYNIMHAESVIEPLLLPFTDEQNNAIKNRLHLLKFVN